jgi:hypothetical protein
MSHWPGFWEIGRSKPRSKLTQILLCSESTHGMLTGQIRTIVPDNNWQEQTQEQTYPNPAVFGINPWHADRTNSYHGTRQSMPKFLKAKRCLLWWPFPLRCCENARGKKRGRGTPSYFAVKRSKICEFLLGPPYDQILSKVLRRKQPSSESDLYPRK